MDNVFLNLLSRPENKKILTLGDPWEIIPIKNKKYAKNCTEIHLANRNIDELTGFDNFPNIEVLWLNNNKLEKIEKLDGNFRIKHLYLQNNKIKTLEGSIFNMMHLETLSLYNNELRGLDYVIDYLKKYTHLKNLDLMGNPLSEEPYYRHKIIQYLPQLKIFDRHIIEFDDRLAAKNTINKINQQIKAKPAKGSKNQQNKQSLERKKRQMHVSACERNLFNEAKQIIRKKELETQRIDSINAQTLKDKYTTNYGNTIPKATIVWEIPQDESEDPVQFVNEWEKDSLKRIFKKYDKDKNATVNLDNLPLLFNELIDDQSLIGKAPNCTYEEFLGIFKLPPSENKIQWDSFRTLINKVKWHKADLNLLQKRIKEKYDEANAQLMDGKKNESFNALFKAIRLESIYNLDDVEKKAFKVIETKKEKTRCDYFDFNVFKYKTKEIKDKFIL